MTCVFLCFTFSFFITWVSPDEASEGHHQPAISPQESRWNRDWLVCQRECSVTMHQESPGGSWVCSSGGAPRTSLVSRITQEDHREPWHVVKLLLKSRLPRHGKHFTCCVWEGQCCSTQSFGFLVLFIDHQTGAMLNILFKYKSWNPSQKSQLKCKGV